MKNHIKYTLKVWLTAVLAAPVIILWFNLLNTTGWGDTVLILMVGIALGFMFSIPSALVFTGISLLISKNKMLNYPYSKLLLNIADIALTCLAFLLFKRTYVLDKDEVYYLTVYAGVIVSSVWYYYRLPKNGVFDDAIPLTTGHFDNKQLSA